MSGGELVYRGPVHRVVAHHIHDPGAEPHLAALVIIESGPCAGCGKHCRGIPDRGGRLWHTACVTLAKSSPF